MNIYTLIPKGTSIESPAIRYFYYVIANTLQSRGEFTKLNLEDMITLAKAAIPTSNMTPKLGAMLLFHLSRQAHHTCSSIICGGVITVLANEFGINLGNVCPLDGNRRVSLLDLSSAGMIITKKGRICIRILGVGHLLLTRMPNVFYIKNRILYYNVHGEDEEEDPDVEMPEDVEEEQGEPEVEVQPNNNEEGEGLYVTYVHVYDLRDSINNMSDLVDALRDTTEAMTYQFTTWSHGWAPGYYQPPPQ